MMSHSKIYWRLILLFLISTFLFSCKTQQPDSKQVESLPFQELLLLINKDMTPTDLNTFSEEQLKSAKRTSRSQNLWLVRVQMEDSEADELVKKLQGLKEIESVSRPAENDNTTTKNKDKKNARPVKN